MNLILWGLILNFVGSSILVFVSLFGKWHQIKYDNPWTKGYWWMGRRPFYKNTKTLKWHFKWNHIVIVEGFIPPKHLWNSIGFLFIASGFLLQIIGL
jgi:hypothetical protein